MLENGPKSTCKHFFELVAPFLFHTRSVVDHISITPGNLHSVPPQAKPFPYSISFLHSSKSPLSRRLVVASFVRRAIAYPPTLSYRLLLTMPTHKVDCTHIQFQTSSFAFKPHTDITEVLQRLAEEALLS